MELCSSRGRQTHNWCRFYVSLGLLVDCRNKRLMESVTTLSTPGILTNCRVSSIKFLSGNSEYHQLLQEYPDVTNPSGLEREVKHNTVHYIKTAPGPPVHCRPRRLAPDRLECAKQLFEEMLRDGTARKSDSTWASALHLAPKSQTSWRPCGDY